MTPWIEAKDVVLVAMPWAQVDQPSLQLGILQARLRRAGISVASFYAHLRFAQQLGVGTYESYGCFHNLLADWAFAEALHDPATSDPPRFYAFARAQGADEAQLAEARRIRAMVPAFLDWCLAAIDWGSVRVVGFTTTMLQPVPALALAARLRSAFPRLRIVFGGAGCSGVMGKALHRNFPFVDGVVDGEADETITPIVRTLLAREEPRGLPGLSWRHDDGTITSLPGRPTASLHDYPRPCYDDYFTQLAACDLSGSIDPRIPFEASRGCWWAVKSHCDFCGQNGAVLTQRTRPVSDVVEELVAHRAQFAVDRFAGADNIMAPTHIVRLPLAIRRALPGIRLFFEVRAVLRRAHLEGLARAGFVDLQPGIESLITDVLDLVHKGTTAIDNICFLRRASELGITVHWNFLYGLPGERREWYEALFPRLAQLYHLQVPDVVQFSLQRFSPYFDDPQRHQIEIQGTLPGYHYIWRLPEAEMRDLCFDLDFRAPGSDSRADTAMQLRLAVRRWRASSAELTARLAPGGSVRVWDTRPCAAVAEHRLPAAVGAVLRCVESPRTREEIVQRLLRHRAADYLALGGRRGVERALDRLQARSLVYEERDRMIALVVPPGPSFWIGLPSVDQSLPRLDPAIDGAYGEEPRA